MLHPYKQLIKEMKIEPNTIINYNTIKTFTDIKQIKTFGISIKCDVDWYQKLGAELLCYTGVLNALFILVNKKKMTYNDFREQLTMALISYKESSNTTCS